MIRFFLNKTFETPRFTTTQTLQTLLLTYQKHKYYSTNYNFELHYFQSTFNLTLPQRQQCFSFYDLHTHKHKSFTMGKFLSNTIVVSKFYKRSTRNIGGVILSLKKDYALLFSRIFLFKILNFNLKQWLFWERFEDSLHPKVKFFLHKKSYLPRWQGKRRIKRVVLRKLIKQ